MCVRCIFFIVIFFFFKQKTAYEMRISDWSSDVCSSDLKLDFVERMTRWSETLALPTLLVGDFNIAPLPSDVWGHKQLLKVVSHTPVEVDALDALRASNSWVDLGRYFHPAPARDRKSTRLNSSH